MKTFEERYTAWIDGQLEGPALTAFELELSRRASAGEARSDKRGAEQLRSLLKAGLQAPAMTNIDFFSHQLNERIAAERLSETRREQPRRKGQGLFAWSFGQLASLGAACLFCGVALYYGLMPEAGSSYGDRVNKMELHTPPGVAMDTNRPPTPESPNPAVAPGPRDPAQGVQLANRSPTPAPVETSPPADIQKVQVVEQSKDTTSATPLHYQKPDVNVIWINGLDYLPNVPDDSVAKPVEATPNPPAPVSATARP